MTNEELVQKMEENMKMRNFSHYSFYAYIHKVMKMIKYIGKGYKQRYTILQKKIRDVKRIL